MRKLFLFFNIFRAFVLLGFNPKRTEEVLRLATAMHAAGLYDEVIQRLKAHPNVRKIFESRYSRGLMDVQALGRLPVGSFGYEFAQFCERNAIDPNFFYQKDRILRNDHDYYEVRVRETHDLWHVILGFEADEVGEIGVQGFMIAQFNPPLSAFLVGGSFLRILFKFPSQLPIYVESLSRGFQIGKNCTQFLGEKWEDHWESPLALLRRKYLMQLSPEPRSRAEV